MGVDGLIVQFATLIGTVPHRETCERTRHLSHRCTCDIGDAALIALTKCQDLVLLAFKKI